MEGRFYTRARRQPWVLGKLGKDWVLPWVLSSEEIVTILAVVGTLAATRGVCRSAGVVSTPEASRLRTQPEPSAASASR